jgi:4-hydroxyacetophenone monooxygenase
MNEEGLLEALRDANLPTLVPVLYQLTGDRAWLAPRYHPTRSQGLDDNPTGGFPPDVQEELRQATARAVLRWAGGEPVARPAPRGRELIELMTFSMGEDVPDEYEPMTAEELGFAPAEPPRPGRDGATSGLPVIIIGAGISGLILSRNLTLAGIPHVIFEKNDRVGGTWVNNPYPGCGVDTPSYLYSFSFYQREWSQHFAKRAELETYIGDMARDLDLLKNVRFGVDVLGATWNDEDGMWTVSARSADGGVQEHAAPVLVSAVGQLSKPKLPDIKGLETFRGEVFHSSHWPDGLDLSGKRVAIAGTGASAMQIVPAIVDEVAELTIFQRSPQWVAPSSYYFEPIPPGVHFLMRHVPFYYEWYRVRLGWIFNDKVHPSLQLDPDWPLRPRSINAVNEAHRRHFERYLRAELDGRPDLVEKALPGYPPFGKRMLLDNGWFRALRREHVELVTDGVAELTEDQVVTASGEKRPADIVVLATGFEAQRPTFPLVLKGRDGVTLRDAWNDDDGRAFLGVATPGFPNLFILYGPNSSLGHGGSFIFLAERTANYVTDLLCRMVDTDAGVVEIRADEWERYTQAVDEAHAKMIWTQPGFTTWYANSRGRVIANMPWRVVDFWKLTRAASPAHYRIRYRRPAGPDAHGGTLTRA